MRCKLKIALNPGRHRNVTNQSLPDARLSISGWRLLQNMKTTSSRFAGFIALFAISPLSVHAATQLQGAGATFPAPLYQRWIAEFSKANPGTQINYQGVGSGAGIKQFTDSLVTFGASDAAMTDAQIEKVKQG